MDWSAIFAGGAALISVIALVYGIHQHRDTVRKEFIIWALEQMQSPSQRETRALLWRLNRPENESKKMKIIEGIVSGKEKVLYGKDVSQFRAAFALYSQIGYFWAKLGYGNLKDVKNLFPQFPDLWRISEPYITAIRGRPHQSESFLYFEKIAKKLR